METTKPEVKEEEPKSFFQKLGGWFKEIKNVFIRPKPLPEGIINPAPEELPDPLKKLMGNLENESLHYSKSLFMPAVEQDFLLSVRFMLDAGITNGVYGIKDARNNEITVIAKSRAERLSKLAKTVLAGVRTKAETEEEAKLKLMKRNEQQDKQQHQYLDLLHYYRRHHQRSFNGFWSGMCIVFGLVLIFVDFPLSRKLFEQGLDLRRGESGIIAAGLSLCTIFIKIYYDNYIELRYGNALITNSKFAEMYSPDSDRNGKDYSAENITEQKAKKRWHNAILVFTIAGMIILGFFRVNAMKQPFPDDFWKYSVNIASFIFLTLIFPVVSGICLSIGMTIAQNKRRYKETEKACKESKEKYIESLSDYTAIKQNKADIQSELEKWEKENFTESHKEIFLSYYDNGYKLGAANPDIGNKDKDFFTLAEQWRNKALSRKTNNHIIKISGL